MGKENYENHSTYAGNKNYSLVGKGILYDEGFVFKRRSRGPSLIRRVALGWVVAEVRGVENIL